MTDAILVFVLSMKMRALFSNSINTGMSNIFSVVNAMLLSMTKKKKKSLKNLETNFAANVLKKLRKKNRNLKNKILKI